MKDIAIREVAPNDILAIVQLLMDMWAIHSAKEPQYINTAYITTELASEYVEKAIEADNQAIFIAEIDNRIIGSARVEIIELERFFTQDKAAYFDDLVVRSDYRRKGVATKLFRAREEYAQQRGVKMIKTRIHDFNEPAKALAIKNKLHPLYTEYYKVLD